MKSFMKVKNLEIPRATVAWSVNHAHPWIADTPAKVEAVNALGLAAPVKIGDHTPYWPLKIDKGYAKHA